MSTKAIKRFQREAAGRGIGQRKHQHGYDLWRASVQVEDIKKRLKITAVQWRWLLEEGNGSTMPAYKDMIVSEVAEIRTASSEAARTLAIDGANVLQMSVENARKANELVSGILSHIASDIFEAGRMQAAQRAIQEGGGEAAPFLGLADVMPGKSVLDCLKVLSKYADMSKIAASFQSVYGEAALQKALYRTVDAANGEEGKPLDLVQGEQAQQDQQFPPEMVSRVIGNMADWSDEDVQRFADGEDEPPPAT